ncbi:distal tail protein Dit [Marinococcus luteus]|uniref:distal tail protein Dit n=1 Tax=Marinococcus luteus TaxID=1122204 RepID=UPI002ACC7CDE|nr:distal tail protein Dit [Marinococcus luteus]MDZ5782112.1 phage tail family protein [Marinococcus luteus]
MKYDGDTLDDLLDVTGIEGGLLPEQQTNTTTLPERPGRSFFSKRHGIRMIGVNVVVRAGNEDTFFDRERNLAGKLNKPAPRKLFLYDDSALYIWAILAGSTDIEQIVNHGRGQLPFECYDPFFYDDDETASTFESEGNKTMTNKGNDDSFPKYEIKGVTDGGEIDISIANRTLRYDGPLISGETLVLDSETITAYVRRNNGTKAGVLSGLNTLRFPKLAPGKNELSIGTSGGAEISEVRVTPRSRWV